MIWNLQQSKNIGKLEVAGPLIPFRDHLVSENVNFVLSFCRGWNDTRWHNSSPKRGNRRGFESSTFTKVYWQFKGNVLVSDCSVSKHFVIYQLNHLPMPLCPQLCWAKVAGGGGGGGGWWRGTYYIAYSLFICPMYTRYFRKYVSSGFDDWQNYSSWGEDLLVIFWKILY